MNPNSSDYKNEAVVAMESAVSLGAFKATTRPSEEAKKLVLSSIDHAREYLPPASQLRVLECGCGSGAWLEVLLKQWKDLPPGAVHGFDLTPLLIKEAQERLGSLMPLENLACGDILEDASYIFGHPAGYDLIYCYDVVQQLPRRLQSQACQTMYAHLTEGGCLLVFDHHKWSRYGVVMALKKWVTKYLRIPLVPRYFCAARYPDLSRVAAQLTTLGATCEVIRIAETPKRALLARCRGLAKSCN